MSESQDERTWENRIVSVKDETSCTQDDTFSGFSNSQNRSM